MPLTSSSGVDAPAPGPDEGRDGAAGGRGHGGGGAGRGRARGGVAVADQHHVGRGRAGGDQHPVQALRHLEIYLGFFYHRYWSEKYSARLDLCVS